MSPRVFRLYPLSLHDWFVSPRSTGETLCTFASYRSFKVRLDLLRRSIRHQPLYRPRRLSLLTGAGIFVREARAASSEDVPRDHLRASTGKPSIDACCDFRCCCSCCCCGIVRAVMVSSLSRGPLCVKRQRTRREQWSCSFTRPYSPHCFVSPRPPFTHSPRVSNPLFNSPSFSGSHPLPSLHHIHNSHNHSQRCPRDPALIADFDPPESTTRCVRARSSRHRPRP